MKSNVKLGREDYKKKKELEELRKLGAAPAEVDDEGYIINPHIPQYMAEAPWYLSDGRPGLRHQRIAEGRVRYAKVGEEVSKRGVKKGKKKKKRWQEGSCENCGAATHQTKECLARPRRRPAKYSHQDLQDDEFVPQKQNFTWDGKRDRWNNYDLGMHQLVIERHEKMRQYRHKKKTEELDQAILDGDEDAKRKLKKLRKRKAKARGKKSAAQGGDSDSDSDSDSDESGMDSDDDLRDKGEVIQRFDSKHRQTVRNLRLREDLPKYLRDFRLDGAYYDPKTRAMRADPYEGMESSDVMFRGDNALRNTGDTVQFSKLRKFAWDTRDVNAEAVSEAIHLQANPTLTEKAHKSFTSRKTGIKSLHRQKILEQYGGEEHLRMPEEALVVGQTEAYAVYGHDGRVVKGRPEYVPSSKYQEGLTPGNHSSVWGSFYDTDKALWGYACCQATSFHAYCTGVTSSARGENVRERREQLRRAHLKATRAVATVTAKPKEASARDKLVNPSGYVSTKGIMAQKGIARKLMTHTNNLPLVSDMETETSRKRNIEEETRVDPALKRAKG